MNATSLSEISYVRRAYRQLFELGRGGMARVYLAENLASGVRKLVVLKILNPELCADPEMRASFRREAELSAQMNHPNVVQVMEVVEYSAAPVIVMEYLDGTTLSSLLKRAGERVPLPLHLHVLSQVLAGLHHFHELRDLDGTPLNAVHRDVSPQNVMVLHDGPVKVLDFGIAKVSLPDDQATRAGMIKGKLHYMPPEQLFGDADIDRRADIFAVGVMLWEAVAGRRMWEGKAENEVLRNLATGELPPIRSFAAGAPESVLELVERATAVERERRFATAHEMQAAVERALAQEGWLVQPGKIAEFMHQHFGESRRVRALEIKSALREPGDADGTLECISGAYAVHDPSQRPQRELAAVAFDGDRSGSSGRPTGHSSVSRVLRTSARHWRWAIPLLCGLGLAGAWIARRSVAARPPAAQAAPTKTASLEVEVLPRGAEIFLDGKSLGTDRFLGPQPVTDHKLLLEVNAPGYLSERREILVRQDTTLQIVLKPDPALAPPALAAPSASSPSLDAALPHARVLTRNGAHTKKSKSGAHSSKCNPPFTFSADGVKTYKPECF